MTLEHAIDIDILRARLTKHSQHVRNRPSPVLLLGGLSSFTFSLVYAVSLGFSERFFQAFLH